MSMRVTGLLILLVSTAGCSGSRPAASPRSVASAADPAGASQSARAQPELARGCPDPQSPPGGGRAAVDYVDFLQANGRNYIADLGGNRLTIRPTDLGRVALQVRCSYAAVNDATGLVFGKPRDGDAAFLAPGTNVYGVRGWPPLCRLAAMHDHEWHVYLAYRPDATVATAEPCALHRGS
jgi:hypothetical protein